MGGLDKNRFNYDGNLDYLSRKKLKSQIDDYFDPDHAMHLSTVLGSSSRSNYNSDDDDDDDSHSSDGGDSSSDDGGDSSASVSSDDGDGDGDDTSGGEGDEEGEEEDEGQEDTHLKMFLENLEADGTSFVLKRNGKPDLKFEGLDEDGDGSCGLDDNVVEEEVSGDFESERRRREGCDLDARSGGGKGKGILREDGIGCSRDVEENGNVDRRVKGVGNGGKKKSFVDKGKGVLGEGVDVVSGKRGGKTVKNVESGKDCLVRNGDCRPVKRREGGVKNVEKKQSIVENKKYRAVEQVDLTKVKRRGKNVDKKSVVENESDSSVQEVNIRLDGKRFSRNVKENGKLERKAKNVQNVRKPNMDYERNNSVEDVDLRPDGRHFPWNVKENGELERRAKDIKNVKREKSYKENARDGSTGELGLRSEKVVEVSYTKKGFLSEKIRAPGPDTDPDYMAFFDNIKEMNGGKLVLDLNGKIIIYGEEDDKSLSDSEVCVLDHAPDCIELNYAPNLNYNAHMEEDDLQCLGSCSAAENPEFRKAVMDILRKPFKLSEYNRLQDDVKRRKLTVRHVDMRSGNTSFQQPTMGKSYLDHYADLKKQFDAFNGDKPKRLNILRGFFFYLKRMADDGKFKPWLDDSCLAIIPRTG
ncbi:hypothetical protein POM88_045898 [Heracleum sosnowskyi]|uniref:Uncharacterized protein n=1 Tax=Heracleum sosnowskyi TaxID=360622 RepID=A0AAD8H821_9APIA|nr:hypothetical protein POM88_045898 [Heracleum sosnowskyi]